MVGDCGMSSPVDHFFSEVTIWLGWWYTYHLEKYEFVNGKDDIPYMKWKIKFMFETTNQLQ